MADNPLLRDLEPLDESVNRLYGEAGMYPLIPILINPNVSEAAMSDAWHAYIWLLYTLGAFALYSICRALGLNRAMACFGALLLLLSPRFFAHGHYNNKDILAFVFEMCCIWQALRLMKKPSFSAALFFGLCGALLFNTRTALLAVWGMCGLFVLLHHLIRKSLSLRVCLMGGAALASLAAFYALLTPALWSSPLGFLQYALGNNLSFSRWAHRLLYQGELYRVQETPIPWHYLPYYIYATTPLWIQALALAGVALAAVMLARRKGRSGTPTLPLCMLTCLWLLPIIYASASHTIVYNGWRHFYFTYAPMLALAAYAASRLVSLRKKGLRIALCGALALCCVLTGTETVLNHPYQYVYFQPIERQRIIKDNGLTMNLDYWSLSMKDALYALLEYDQSGEVMTVSCLDTGNTALLRQHLAALPEEVSSRFQVLPCNDPEQLAMYRVSNPSYEVSMEVYPSETMWEIIEIKAYGLPIMLVYEDEEALLGEDYDD